jgi:large subunit ribosomal protein L4
MYRGAMCSMLSELVRQERLLVMDEFGVTAPKTKELRVKLQELGTDNALIVVEGFDENLWLAARNLPHVEVVEARSIDPVSLAKYNQVIMTVPAVKILEERLG